MNYWKSAHHTPSIRRSRRPNPTTNPSLAAVSALIFITLLLTWMLPLGAAAGDVSVTLGWTAPDVLSGEPALAGYRVYYGTNSRSSGSYSVTEDVGLTTSATVNGLAADTTYYFAVTAYNELGIQSDYSEELVHTTSSSSQEPPDYGNVLVNAQFNSGADGFVYRDDAFRGTANPSYASGNWTSSGGYSGGGLRVKLGGIDDADIFGMSGGWRIQFSLAESANVALSFQYQLTQAAGYNSGEYSQALVSLNGALLGQDGADYLTQLAGGSGSGSDPSSGWRLFQADVGTLAAGTHTVVIGGYNNQKTGDDEITEVYIDNVVVAAESQNSPPVLSDPGDQQHVESDAVSLALQAADADGDALTFSASGLPAGLSINSGSGVISGVLASGSAGTYSVSVSVSDGQATDRVSFGWTVDELVLTVPTDSTVLAYAPFDSGTDGFVYRDDAFRGTDNPAYASGTWTSTGGYSGGGLRVQLGGIDNASISGMSGGWRLPFHLPETSRVTVSFRYRLIQSTHMEQDEVSQALASFDGVLLGQDGMDYLAQFAGDDDDLDPDETTGWRLFSADLGELPSGTHTLVLGAYNNRKTSDRETTEVYLDDVVIAADPRNSPPVLADPGDQLHVESEAVSLALQAADADGDALYFSASGLPPGLRIDSGSGLISGTLASGSAGTYSVTVSVSDGQASDSVSFSWTVDELDSTPPADASVLVYAPFDSGADGFVYRDDAFRGTANPSYASGNWTSNGGYSGGGLRVQLGGIDNASISGMSGGWRLPFHLPDASRVTVSFRYKLIQSTHMEQDEFSQALASFDGVLLGQDGTDYLAQFAGDNDDSDPDETTGWRLFSADLGELSAGTHTLVMGAYNNRKTSDRETTEVYLDDVIVAAESNNSPPVLADPGDQLHVESEAVSLALQTADADNDALTFSASGLPPGLSIDSGSGLISGTLASGSAGTYSVSVSVSDGQASDTVVFSWIVDSVDLTLPGDSTVLAYAPFDSGSDGFVYRDDAFRGTDNPAYASGTWTSSGGYSGGGLRVQLGGIDDADISGMSGGWRLAFHLSDASRVTVSFRYKLIQATYMEKDEFSQALASFDGVLLGQDGTDYLAQFVGDDDDSDPAETTGWRLFSADLGELPAGTHILVIGGYNNRKTHHRETTEVSIDDVVVAAEPGS